MRPFKQLGRGALSPAPTLSVLTALVVVLVVVSTGTATATPIGEPFVVQPSRALAILGASQSAMSAPDERSATLQWVGARRPITGKRTVLPVVGRSSDADGVEWLHVMLPGRPRRHTGWIKRLTTRAAHTSWHIVVELSRRRVTVYHQGHPVRVFLAVVGKPATPTPRGDFFVEEAVRLRAGDLGAPFALALSARSNILQEYYGHGQIALHGLANVGGVPGTAVSHGCVRLDAAAMSWLVARIGPGVPVAVRA